jgi:hypothetical protein
MSMGQDTRQRLRFTKAVAKKKAAWLPLPWDVTQMVENYEITESKFSSIL